MPNKGYKHTEESKEKMRLAKIGKLLSLEHKTKIGEASKRIGISPETRAKMVATRKRNGTYIFSKEQLEKMRIARRKRVITAETRAKLGNTTKGHKYALGYKHSNETKKHMSQFRKEQWRNTEYRNKVVQNTRLSLKVSPNKPETIILNMLNQIAPNQYKFVGDGQVVIEGRNPDFINTNGEKKIVECYGDYWHRERARCYEETEQGRIELFAKYGYMTLVIWESEIKNPAAVLAKIADFCKAEVHHA